MLNKNLLERQHARKKQKYLNMMYQILEIPDGKEKLETFMKLYTSYCIFCYKHGLSTDDTELLFKSKTLFIIESRPIEYVIDNDKKQEVLQRLEKVLTNIKNGVPDGISIEDANLILAADVQNARIGLSNGGNLNEIDFFKASLEGACGLSQAATVLPLLELGAQVTINNICSLPDCDYKHAFATCTLPIKDCNQIYEKQFLIDISYRQFFLAIICNKGRYYEGDIRFKNKTSPSAGYYVCQTSEGIRFAKELLTKGYVELTEDNARIYGTGFSMEKISLSTSPDAQQRIISHTGKEYIDAINNKDLQQELDYTTEDLIGYGFNVSLHNQIDDIKKVTNENFSI